MKRILVIYPNYGKVITGGQVYDHYFIDRLSSNKNLDIDIFENDPHCNNNLSYMLEYLKLSKRIKHYDLVIANSRYYSRFLLLFCFVRMFTKTKSILFHHHFSFMIEKGLIRFLHIIFELCFISLSNSVIVPSPYVKDLMKGIFPRKKLHYISLAFQNTEKKILSPLADNNLLYVGTIEPRKGIIYLLESLKLLMADDVSSHLNIVGLIVDEKYYLELCKFIKANNLDNKISFLGRVSKGELENLYQHSTCLVFPSLHEGYGMVLIEAMSYGLPVVAFNNSAISYTLKNNENGILVKNLNTLEMKESIKSILLDVDLRMRLGEGANKTYLNSKKYSELDAEILAFSQLLEN